MIYWQIALAFFLISFIGCCYSMWQHERDFNVFHGILERAGVCFVVGVAWPLTMVAVIALAVSSVMKGTNERQGRTME